GLREWGREDSNLRRLSRRFYRPLPLAARAHPRENGGHCSLAGMEFRRVGDLPPYVFATVDELKRRLRREGRDVIDLGFGNPDIPSPALVVEKLAEAAAKPANHRYSASRGIPRLRDAVAELYERRFSVRLDPEREVVAT